MSHIVLDFLAEHPISDLAAHGVYARWSTANPRKCSLNYDMIEARDGDPIAEHCRGLVVEQLDGLRGCRGTYRVLARPMRRFYNLGSQHAAPIDWSRARFAPKWDGTLVIVYYDPTIRRWCVATRSMPDADVPASNGETYAEMFSRVADLHQDHGSLFGGSFLLSTSITYCYELIGPGNRHTVEYPDWSAEWLAAIDIDTGTESPGYAVRGLACPETLDEALAENAARPGIAHEGWIASEVRGREILRVKIKSPNYLAAVRAVSEAGTDRGKVACILAGTIDDVRPMLGPVQAARVDELVAGVRTLATMLDCEVTGLQREDLSRKAVALRVQAGPLAAWLPAVMDIWSGRHPNAGAWLASKADSPSMCEKIAAFAGGAR